MFAAFKINGAADAAVPHGLTRHLLLDDFFESVFLPAYSWLRFRRRFAVSPTSYARPAAGAFTAGGTKAAPLGGKRTGGKSSDKPVQCPLDNRRFAVELTTVNNRRSQCCWTVKDMGEGCPPGLHGGDKCCTDTPSTFVLRKIGKGAGH